MLGKAIALAVNHRLEVLPLDFRRQFRGSTSRAHCHRFGRDGNTMNTLFVKKRLLLSVEFTILLTQNKTEDECQRHEQEGDKNGYNCRHKAVGATLR